MKIVCKLIALFICYWGMCAPMVSAQEKESVETDTTQQKKGLPEISEFIKPEAVVHKGMFNVYEQDDKYYMEISDAMMEREFVTMVSIIKGSEMPKPTPTQMYGYAGDALSHTIISFEKGPKDKIFLKKPSYGYAVTDTTMGVYQAVKNSTLIPVLYVFDVKAKSENSVLIDMTAALTGDNDIFSLKASARKLGLGGFQADRSYMTKTSCFKNNIIFRSVKSYAAGSRSLPPSPANPKGGSEPTPPTRWEIGVSIALLPEEPMRPRFEDIRVGYFTNMKSDMGANPYKAERTYLVSRWRLDPKPEDMEKYKRGELVEPVKPIVFYIDRNTPKFLQPYFVEAVNLWQPVFEKIGFKNAIIGKMAPTPEEDPDFSMEDVRYSVISYKASLVPNAYGPHMADPRSGEILCSHIGIFHNVMEMVQQWYFCQAAASDPRVRQCPMPENVVGDVMRFVVAHEVGHTLGLRHNFGASSLYPVEKLRDKEYVKKNGHTASIMDYARMNYIAQPEDHIDVKDLIPRIGIYDEFAIEWGYRYFPGMDLKEETEYLRNWVTQKYKEEPKCMFGTELDMSDPRFQNEDLGDNSMKAGEYGIKNLKLIMNNLEGWTKGDDDDATYLKMMYNGVLNQYMYFISHVLKNVGGRYSEMPLRSNGKAESRMVEKERQQEAMEFLTKHVFTSPEWLFEKRIVGLSGIDKLRTQGNIQRFVIQNLLPKTAFLSSCMDLYGREGNYTPEDYFNDLENGIFSDLKNGEAIPAYRRDLQMEYLRQVMAITQYSEVRKTSNLLTLFTLQLENIAKTAEAYKMKAPDKASEMHAETIVKTVEAWLNGEKSGLYLK